MREVLLNDELDRLGITRDQYDATFSDIREYLEETEEGFSELE